MVTLRLFVLLVIVCLAGCSRSERATATNADCIPPNAEHLPALAHLNTGGKGALLLTRFKSLEELKAVVRIEYFKDGHLSDPGMPDNNQVRLTHCSGGQSITGILKPGISEADFRAARAGAFKDQLYLGLHSPYSVLNRENLKIVETLARRRYAMWGEGDVAFYDLAETTVFNISDDDLMFVPSEDLSEKGYINTFNHVTAQAFMTSIFSERLAELVADVHERYRMPELITGVFTADQLADLQDGPVDNYIDMVNNEWGQELGKLLKKKYNINRETYWTPELLANYLNDIQSYYSWAFQIGFNPYSTADKVVIRFSNKINRAIEDLPE